MLGVERENYLFLPRVHLGRLIKGIIFVSNSRDIILNRLKEQNVPLYPLPDMSIVDSFGLSSELNKDRFGKALESVGGKAIGSFTKDNLESSIHSQGVKKDLSNCLCLTDLIFTGMREDYLGLNIRRLAEIDYAIVDAEIGVAQNGAVWIREPKLAHRSALFIVQHLIVLLDESKIVENMHEAYKILDTENEFANRSFGCFISGPSKTADIEQSLVIGAHGTRSHTVYLYNS
jgi:L-lactate dehydrogenase complex protein LldG